MASDWRNSKWFLYGWYPFRMLALGLAYLATGILMAAVFLTWFQPFQVKEVWRRLR